MGGTLALLVGGVDASHCGYLVFSVLVVIKLVVMVREKGSRICVSTYTLPAARLTHFFISLFRHCLQFTHDGVWRNARMRDDIESHDVSLPHRGVECFLPLLKLACLLGM